MRWVKLSYARIFSLIIVVLFFVLLAAEVMAAPPTCTCNLGTYGCFDGTEDNPPVCGLGNGCGTYPGFYGWCEDCSSGMSASCPPQVDIEATVTSTDCTCVCPVWTGLVLCEGGDTCIQPQTGNPCNTNLCKENQVWTDECGTICSAGTDKVCPPGQSCNPANGNCEDDCSDYLKHYKNYGSNWGTVDEDASDEACCPANTDCVASATCYDGLGAGQHIGNSDQQVCYSNGFYWCSFNSAINNNNLCEWRGGYRCIVNSGSFYFSSTTPTEDCSDTYDNDCDSAADCADSDCDCDAACYVSDCAAASTVACNTAYSDSCGFACGTGTSCPVGQSCTASGCCDEDMGDSCQSAPNICGMRNTGTIQCNGLCSASVPSDALCSCTPPQPPDADCNSAGCGKEVYVCNTPPGWDLSGTCAGVTTNSQSQGCMDTSPPCTGSQTRWCQASGWWGSWLTCVSTMNYCDTDCVGGADTCQAAACTSYNYCDTNCDGSPDTCQVAACTPYNYCDTDCDGSPDTCQVAACTPCACIVDSDCSLPGLNPNGNDCYYHEYCNAVPECAYDTDPSKPATPYEVGDSCFYGCSVTCDNGTTGGWNRNGCTEDTNKQCPASICTNGGWDNTACGAGEVCGDGTKEGSEQCDFGDNVSGDGCSDTCQYEGCEDWFIGAYANGGCSNTLSDGYTLTWEPPTGHQWSLPATLKQVLRVDEVLAEVNSGCPSGSPPGSDCDVYENNLAFSSFSYIVPGILLPDTTYFNRVAAICGNLNGTTDYIDIPAWSCTTGAAGPTLANLSGWVTQMDGVTHINTVEVSIVAPPAGHKYLTGNNGYYKIENVPVGTRFVSAKKQPGYRSKTVSLVLYAGENELNFSLGDGDCDQCADWEYRCDAGCIGAEFCPATEIPPDCLKPGQRASPGEWVLNASGDGHVQCCTGEFTKARPTGQAIVQCPGGKHLVKHTNLVSYSSTITVMEIFVCKPNS